MGGNSPHLSEEQFARFEDGELSGKAAGHLESCLYCQSRLNDLRSATAAYAEYRKLVRAPQTDQPPVSWDSLSAIVARNQPERRFSLGRWWPIPALAAALCLVAALTLTMRPSRQGDIQTSELLLRAERVDLPQGRRISMRVQGRTYVRPAVLTTYDRASGDADVERVQELFVAANYSWAEPLSARSYRAWRSSLKDKSETVSIIRQQGQERAYRVQTDTPSGVLRSASLTLQAENLRPTNGTFRFETAESVELDEAVPLVRAEPKASASVATAPVTETPAGPEDTLHVLAALNSIGADVGEPIEVIDDPLHRRVLIQANGISPERWKQVESVLKTLPRAVLVPEPRRPDSSRSSQPQRAETVSTNIPLKLRQYLEDRFGGMAPFQEATDRILEYSASLVARSRALETLANKFPPEVETRLAIVDRALLDSLRQKHVSDLARLVAALRAELEPLTSPKAEPAQTRDRPAGEFWQSDTSLVVASTREADRLLNNLLSGRYSQASGEEMLKELPARIEALDLAVRLQSSVGR